MPSSTSKALLHASYSYALSTNTGSKYTLLTHLLRLVIPDNFHASSGVGRGLAQTSFVYTHPSVQWCQGETELKRWRCMRLTFVRPADRFPTPFTTSIPNTNPASHDIWPPSFCLHECPTWCEREGKVATGNGESVMRSRCKCDDEGDVRKT